MARHTTFRVGGPADLYARPDSVEDLLVVLEATQRESIPCFVLGGGANIVVSDAGIRGVVVDMGGLDATKVDRSGVWAGAGSRITDVSALAADNGLAGLEFIYAMPGSAGGAVWMNARCYGSEIADVLEAVELVTRHGRKETYLPAAHDFSYKRSPFQDNNVIMTGVRFRLSEGDKNALWNAMRGYEEDRRAKGHFDAPCAGSVFKNNRAFGRPSGVIIDELGLRGRQLGGARVSDRHANIIVNTGTATAQDIRELVELVQETVLQRTSHNLECEIMFVGDWGRT